MTDTPEMVERVARAICSGDGSNPDRLVAYGQPERASNNTFVVPQNGVPHWQTYVWQASAAIEVMREPTQGMVGSVDVEIHRAGNDETNITSELSDKEIIEVWSAMIDAALGRKP
jgi:hypothetical protein